jgi:uncharacterized protein YoxC
MTLTISVAIIAAIMVIVGVVAVVALIYIIRLAKALTVLTENVKTHMAPVAQQVTDISAKTNLILDSVNRQVRSMEDSVHTVKDMTVRVRQFEEDILQKVSSPLIEVAGYVAAIRKGFDVFFKVLRS